MANLQKWSGLLKGGLLSAFAMFLAANCAFAGEADLVVPNLAADSHSFNLLLVGIGISVLGLVFGLIEFIKKSETLFLKLVRHTLFNRVNSYSL